MRGTGTEPALAFSYYVDLSRFPLRHVFATAGTVLDFKRCMRAYFDEHATRRVHGEVDSLAVIDGAVVVESGASVGPLAVIQGPAYVCAGARVRPHAYVRNDVIIGPGCLVGHASEITRSVMLPGSRAAHFAFVGDTLIGNDVNLGSHAVFTTLRVDRAITEPATEEITVRIGPTVYGTGYTKFGAVMGDGSRVAAHTSVSPGTLVGPHVTIYPRDQARGTIAPWARV